MALRPLKGIAALALCVATVAPAMGTPAMAGLCAPEKLVRIETTNMSPGIRKDSFAAMPKVLYRLGSRKARLEEQLDPAENIHMLFVMNAPRSWIVDLVSKKAQLVFDPDPTPDIHVPIFNDNKVPAEIVDVEFGCEAAFIAHPATGHEASKAGNGGATKHFIRSGPWKLTLVTLEGSSTPRMALLLKDEKVVNAIRYGAYQELADVPEGLFGPPAGIEIKEPPAPK